MMSLWQIFFSIKQFILEKGPTNSSTEYKATQTTPAKTSEFFSLNKSRIETQLEKILSIKKKLLESKLTDATFKNIDDEKGYTETSKALRNLHIKKSKNKHVRQLYLDFNEGQSAALKSSIIASNKTNLIASIKNEAGVITDNEGQNTSIFHGKNLRTLQKWRKKSTGT